MTTVSLPPLICVTGPDGSGKSTLIESLQRRISNLVAVSIWDLLKNPETRHLLPFQSSAQVDDYLAILQPEARAYFLLHCLKASLDRALQHRPAAIVLDGYWYKYMATEMAHGGDRELLLSLVQPFPKPDLILHLEADAQTGGQRKEKYSGYECGFAAERNLESFAAFQFKANEALNLLMEEHGAMHIDARNSKEEVLEASLGFIAERLPNLQLRKPDWVYNQVKESKAFQVAVVGIDGTGKGRLLQQLQQSALLAGKKFTLMTCPEFHHTPGHDYAALSKAMVELNDLGDQTGDFGIKGVALYLQMTLFGPVQAQLLQAQNPDYLLIERHALIDTLVYGSFYRRKLMEMGGGAKTNSAASMEALAPLIQIIGPWIQQQNERLGRTAGLTELGANLVKVFGLPLPALLTELSIHFSTTLPHLAVMIDLDPQEAVSRVEHRHAQRELHEETQVLMELRETYKKVLGALAGMGMQTLILPATNATTPEMLAEEVLKHLA